MDQKNKSSFAARGESRRVRPLIVIGILVASVACGCGALYWADRSFGTPLARDSQPVLVLPTLQFDFGKVEAGGKRTAHFQVENAGSRRLILNARSGSCDCLAPGSTELIVPAKASRSLPVTLDTKRLQGPVQMTLRFATNDPQRPKIRLVVLADVIGSTEPDSEAPLAPIAVVNEP